MAGPETVEPPDRDDVYVDGVLVDSNRTILDVWGPPPADGANASAPTLLIDFLDSTHFDADMAWGDVATLTAGEPDDEVTDGPGPSRQRSRRR